MVRETGLAARPLVDDDAVYLVPAPPYDESMPAGPQHQVDGLHVGQETDKGYGLLTVDNANTSLSNDDYDQSNNSYNIFEHSKQSTGMHTCDSPTANGDSERTLYKSPHRSKSMQATPCSPHDAEPFLSMVSPKLSRARSDNGWANSHSSARSTGDRSLAVTIEEPPKKKRGRKRKQTPEGQDEHPGSHGDGASDQNTKTEKRKPGRPPSNAKRNERFGGIHPDPPTPTVEVEIREPLDTNGPAFPANGTQDASTKHRGMESIGADFLKNPETPSNSPAKDTVFAKPAKPAAKGPRKKKLKRGKTTSVTLHKTHEFDVEDDVIWVDDKPPNPVVYEPEGPPLDDRVGNIETHKPAAGVEEAQGASSTNPANAQLEPPGPKKRGRKRKKTSEQMESEEFTSVEEKPSQIQKEPSVNADNTTNQENHPNMQTETNPESIAALEDHIHPSPQPEREQAPVAELECEDEKENPPPTTPQKPSKDSEPPADHSKGPSKHSPIAATSTVPYRVGLSRRARIAPLLRVVRR